MRISGDEPFSGVVDVGTHRLYADVRGAGQPPVILEAGLGRTSEDWEEVHAEIVALTRVLRYDRAGLGRSEPGVLAPTSANVVRDLRALLGAVGLRGPYVLVAHSFGAMHVRYWAASRPDEMAGMVLIDPPHEAYFAELKSHLRDEHLARVRRSIEQLPSASRREFLAVEESAAEMAAAGRIPEIPSCIISSARSGSNAALEEIRRWLLGDLLQRIPGARHVVAKRSGHDIHHEEPGLVIDAIRGVLVSCCGGSPDDGWRPKLGHDNDSFNEFTLSLVAERLARELWKPSLRQLSLADLTVPSCVRGSMTERIVDEVFKCITGALLRLPVRVQAQ